MTGSVLGGLLKYLTYDMNIVCQKIKNKKLINSKEQRYKPLVDY